MYFLSIVDIVHRRRRSFHNLFVCNAAAAVLRLKDRDEQSSIKEMTAANFYRTRV